VTDLATGCISSDTVVIVADDVPPLAAAGPARVLTCAVTEVVLAGADVANRCDGRRARCQAGAADAW